jgi:tetratricopeptide (TPR) repeat protein
VKTRSLAAWLPVTGAVLLLAGCGTLFAGILEDSAAAVQQGVNKVTDALTPAPAVPASDDPTLLSNKAKPSPELYATVAQFYERSGQPAQAEHVYQQSLRLWPKQLTPVLNYARFKDRQGSPQEALRLYQDAARDFPKEAAVYNDQGLFFARFGRTQEALRAFSQAIQLQPKRPLYRNNVAALLVDADRPDQALAQLKAVYGEAEACYKLGYLMEKKGASQEAQRWFARALQINPAMAEARTWLQYLQTSRTDPAAQVARRPAPDPSIPAAGPRPASPSLASPSPPSSPAIIRDVRAEPAIGPRVGPQSEPTRQGPGAVRPLPPSVSPLPPVEEDDRAGPVGRVAPLPDDAPDAPLPLDAGPVRPLPPVR